MQTDKSSDFPCLLIQNWNCIAMVLMYPLSYIYLTLVSPSQPLTAVEPLVKEWFILFQLFCWMISFKCCSRQRAISPLYGLCVMPSWARTFSWSLRKRQAQKNRYISSGWKDKSLVYVSGTQEHHSFSMFLACQLLNMHILYLFFK